MLDKKHRLPKNINFRNIKALSSKAFLVKIKKNEADIFRIGVIVSKKIDGRAVVRNKIKRQIKNCAEKLVKENKLIKDILIIAKKEALGKNNKEVEDQLKKLILR